jgi:hypothetical protein
VFSGSPLTAGGCSRNSRRSPTVSAPGHLLGVVGGDRLIVLAHLGRPPVANPLQQPGQAGVGGRVLAEDEPRPVPARLHLAALAGPALSLGQRPPEPPRPGRAELHRHQLLHPNHPNQARARRMRRNGRPRAASPSLPRCEEAKSAIAGRYPCRSLLEVRLRSRRTRLSSAALLARRPDARVQVYGTAGAGGPRFRGDRQSPIRWHRYGVYRYFLIAGLLTFARVTMAEPVP